MGVGGVARRLVGDVVYLEEERGTGRQCRTGAYHVQQHECGTRAVHGAVAKPRAPSVLRTIFRRK